MRRFLPLAFVALPLFAQPKEPDYEALASTFGAPKNTISVGMRLGGKATVRFGGLGTITPEDTVGDTTSEQARSYYDGDVGLDARTTSDGVDLRDDARTNSWGYASLSQVTADESGIAFHSYSTTSEGAGASASSGASPGVDVEYARQFGEFGRRPADRQDRPARITWGFLLGFGLSDVNAKTRGTINATLHTVTDTYSLLGSAVPMDDDTTDGVAYTAPSTVTDTITNADGTTSSFTSDNTTLLGNRPENRTVTDELGAAEIDGFWQVKGAFFTLRSGPWVRWQPTERIALRFSAGGTISWLGLRMRYDERLKIGDDTTEIKANDETANEGFGIPGYFSGLDAEWWLTPRTGFFGGATYEKFSKDIELSAGDRNAEVQVSSGLGLRIGITTRF